jgi:hypothetical protein
MATNFPGPYAVEITYVIGGLTHKMLLNTQVSGSPDPGDNAALVDLVLRNASTIPLPDAVDDWIALLVPLFSTTSTFVEAVLWRYEPESFDRTFITSYAIGEDGTNAGAFAPAKYRKFSFRTQGGGILYVTLLESIVDGNLQETYPFASGASNAIANYVVAATSWIYARDNTYPISPLRLSDGQNEVLFRKRYRP